MHYVIGDIHGCYQDMIALLNKIESQDQDAQIIFVGDFIDRGPDVDKVLELREYYIRRQIQGGPRKSRADGT